MRTTQSIRTGWYDDEEVNTDHVNVLPKGSTTACTRTNRTECKTRSLVVRDDHGQVYTQAASDNNLTAVQYRAMRMSIRPVGQGLPVLRQMTTTRCRAASRPGPTAPL